MPLIEKAFRIESAPEAIWDSLWADLGTGAEGSFDVQASNWPRGFTLRLDLAGMPCRLSYRIESAADHCEVAAAIEPLSWRYRVYQLFTLGHYRRNFEMLLVISLANLKKAVEGEPAGADEAPGASQP